MIDNAGLTFPQGTAGGTSSGVIKERFMQSSLDVNAGLKPARAPRLVLAAFLSVLAPLSAYAADLPGIFGGQAYGVSAQTNIPAVDAALDRLGGVGLSCIGTEGRTTSSS